jgi:endoglucanase
MEPSESMELLMAELARMQKDVSGPDGSGGSTPVDLRRDSMTRFEESLKVADGCVRTAAKRKRPATKSEYMKRAARPEGPEPEPVAYVRRAVLKPVGVSLFSLFAISSLFYGYVRVAWSLRDLGPLLPFGITVMVIEALGAACMAFYGVWLIAATDDSDVTSAVKPLRTQYTVRVLIPCYRESLAIVRRTIAAARQARRPLGCTVLVYLCDDGNDADKRRYVQSLADDDVMYVTGRKKAGNLNGKSENLNYALHMIYPRRRDSDDPQNIGIGEVVALFDADQTCSADFFEVMLRYLDSGDDVAAALSPQLMHNVLPDCDVFNHQNVHFWESMQPGMNALGFISLTGTNMLLRARALQSCGWFPTTSVTEDWELGMRLCAGGWSCRYVPQYLAIGEAPQDTRQAFQQRSRWCKGHFQTFWSRSCPLFDARLTLFQRVTYSSTCLSYLSAGLATPAMALVPVVTLLFGYFPISMNVWTVIGVTAYYGSMNALTYGCATSRKHAVALWLSNVGTTILFWPYLKAAVTSPYKAFAGKGLTFKATAKGSSAARSGVIASLWPSALLLALSLMALIVGLLDFDVRVNAPKALAMCWVVYNALPHALVLMHAAVGQGSLLTRACRVSMLLSTLAGAGAIVLMWLLYPRNMDYSRAADLAVGFLERERADGAGLAGGFFEDGMLGDVRVTSNVARTTSFLSWSLLDLGDFWRERPDMLRTALDAVEHGADFVLDAVSSTNYTAIVAAGDLPEQAATWKRSDPGSSGPLRSLPLAADTVGQAIAAIAASALALEAYANVDRSAAFSRAEALFEQYAPAGPVAPYPAVNGTADVGGSSGVDDLFWAATWVYRGANDSARAYYFGAMSALMDRAYADLDVMDTSSAYFSNAAVVHAAVMGSDYKFHAAAQSFLWDWTCSGQVRNTLLGRAYLDASPMLGDTVEAAALAAMYARHSAYAGRAFVDGLYCFAESQGRYVLGATTGRSRVIGYGKGPTKTWSRTGTCPPWPAPCGDVRARDAADAYPVEGALLWAPGFTDSVADARGGNATAISLDNNRAMPLLFPALALKAGSYTRCLQGLGGLVTNPTCAHGRPNKDRMGPTQAATSGYTLGRKGAFLRR